MMRVGSIATLVLAVLLIVPASASAQLTDGPDESQEYQTLDRGSAWPTPSTAVSPAANRFANGSFEDGLTGWRLYDFTDPTWPTAVAPAGDTAGFGFFATNPTHGSLSFSHGFDTNRHGGDRLSLVQAVDIPPNGLLLFDYRFAYDFQRGNPATEAREFAVRVDSANTGGGGTYNEEWVIELLDPSRRAIVRNSGWKRGVVDLSSWEGKTKDVRFDFWVPEGATGPAQFEIDNVELRGYASNIYVSNRIASGPADEVIDFGGLFDEMLTGDWNGDGTTGFAARRGKEFRLMDTFPAPGLRAPPPLKTWPDVIGYGTDDDEVFVGDWDGNRIDTFAVRRGNVFHLKNRVSPGVADIVLGYGRAGDEVFVGDWDGDGIDTFAVRRGNVLFVRNSTTTGPADIVFGYGRAGDEMYVGDWNGDGIDTFAVRRGREIFVNNSFHPGPAQHVVSFGKETDQLLVGDWDADGVDTFAVRRIEELP